MRGGLGEAGFSLTISYRWTTRVARTSLTFKLTVLVFRLVLLFIKKDIILFLNILNQRIQAERLEVKHSSYGYFHEFDKVKQLHSSGQVLIVCWQRAHANNVQTIWVTPAELAVAVFSLPGCDGQSMVCREMSISGWTHEIFCVGPSKSNARGYASVQMEVVNDQWVLSIIKNSSCYCC